MTNEQVVKALRHCMTKEDGITICEPCPYYGKGIDCEDVLHTDAAAAIEELQKVNRERTELYEDAVKQLPKHGEWKKGIHMVECSVCSEKIYFGDETWVEDYDICEDIGWHYCPHCGAKMEVQDV